jgi:CDP-diacylglycerol pyrophosphatase
MRAFAVLACAFSAAAFGVAFAFDHDALWNVVHGLCVADETSFHLPAPCFAVDLQGGSAILKDFVGRTQVLLVPTKRLTGIEDPLVGTDALPNYWRAAWAARSLVSKNAEKDLPRDDIGMAINGAAARTQDQLHIHVDCVRADLRRALESRTAEIGAQWTDFRLLEHTYRARRIVGEAPDPDPFRLLAEDTQSSPLRDDSLAIIGTRFADGAPGFIILAERAPHGATRAEELLDHSCAVAME